MDMPPVPMYNCQGCGEPRRTLVVRGDKELCRACADKSGSMTAAQRMEELRRVDEARRGRWGADDRWHPEDPRYMVDPYERMATGDR